MLVTLRPTHNEILTNLAATNLAIQFGYLVKRFQSRTWPDCLLPVPAP
jgi:hypothetical protein